MTRIQTLGAAVAALAFASPAFAQSVTQDNSDGSGKTVILSPLNFINDTNLNFGDVVLPSGNVGQIRIDADPSVPAFVSNIGVQQLPNSVPTRGLMIGAGSAGVDVTVQTVFPTALYLGGDSTAAALPVALTLDATATSPNTYTYTINGGQSFNVYVGGTLDIPASSPDGAYSNTYTVTATYP